MNIYKILVNAIIIPAFLLMKGSIKIKTHRYVEKLAVSSMQNPNSRSGFTQLTEIRKTLSPILSSTNRTTRIFADLMASALFSNDFPYFQTRDFLFNSDIKYVKEVGWFRMKHQSTLAQFTYKRARFSPDNYYNKCNKFNSIKFWEIYISYKVIKQP